MKECTRCHKSLSSASFWMRTSKRKDGTIHRYPNSVCRSCELGKNKLWRDSNPRKRTSQMRKYRILHKNDIHYLVWSRLSTWRRKAKCNLTSDYLTDLFKSQDGRCYYTGDPMTVGAGIGSGRYQPESVSLDRLNPSRGYIKGNVVWCTMRANMMKHSMTVEEFTIQIKKILKNLRAT